MKRRLHTMVLTALVGAILSSFNLFAQDQITVSGVVKASDGITLPGVSIMEKGATNGTVSDVSGKYTMKVPAAASLVFSYVGMEPQEVAIAGRSVIDIVLKYDSKSLNEVVVTGYQQQRKKDLTGAVAVVDVDEMNKQSVANPMKALQGQVPGMYVTGNGAPSSPTTVRIRGIGTLNNNDPLYIIDGVPTKAGMHELNAADIESMQVLKDASSASIYGSRAANGVIVITTKRGKSGGPQLSFTGYTSVSKYANRIKMLDTQGYGKVLWQASVNSNIDPNSNGLQYKYDWNVDPSTNQPVLNSITTPEFLDANKTMRAANTDWFDEISQTGVIQDYNVQVSNGNENGNYLFSLGYYDNKGIIKTTGFNRLSARLNSDYRMFNGKLTLGENLSISKTHEVSADILNAAIQAVPIIPVHTVDGIGWGGPVAGMNDRQNPVRVLEDNKQNGYNFVRLFGSFFADLKIMDGLTIRSNVGFDYGNFSSRNWQKKYQSGYLVNDVNKVINSQTNTIKTTWTNTINYKLDVNRHSLDVVAGTEYFVENASSFNASREGFVQENPDYMYLDAGTGIKDNSGSGAKNVLLSYFAKANYAYLDRYLLSATIRYDGSSRFGANNRFGTFPAFSAGWRISEEGFVKNKINVLDDLKLRVGWGKTGNQEIGNAAIYNLYLSNYNMTSYDINGAKSGVLPSGFYLSQNANPNLKWEATEMTNAGIDFSFFNQKIYGSADYYIKNTSDILLLPPYIGVLGEGGNTWVNGASMENKGFELVLGHRSTVGGSLKLDLSANLDVVRNKVTELPAEVINAYGGDGRGQNILGQTFGSFFGYVADGLFKTQQEVTESAGQPNKGLGRIRYRDLNSDGVINDYDRTWIGSPLPKFTYGFNAALNYKNFDLSFLLQGIGPTDVKNETKYFTDFWSAVESSSNKGARLLDAWTPANPNSTIPAASISDANWEARMSTYFVENGAYLKIRNAQLGYTLGKSAASKIKAQSVRFYIGGDNLAILFKSRSFTGLDPENPAYGYPNPTVFTTGLSVRF